MSLTVVATDTSLPELAVSLVAAIDGRRGHSSPSPCSRWDSAHSSVEPAVVGTD